MDSGMLIFSIIVNSLGIHAPAPDKVPTRPPVCQVDTKKIHDLQGSVTMAIDSSCVLSVVNVEIPDIMQTLFRDISINRRDFRIFPQTGGVYKFKQSDIVFVSSEISNKNVLDMELRDVMPFRFQSPAGSLFSYNSEAWATNHSRFTISIEDSKLLVSTSSYYSEPKVGAERVQDRRTINHQLRRLQGDSYKLMNNQLNPWVEMMYQSDYLDVKNIAGGIREHVQNEMANRVDIRSIIFADPADVSEAIRIDGVFKNDKLMLTFTAK